MYVIIYKSRLRSQKIEIEYIKHWRKVGEYFRDHCGAIGTALHKTADGEWISYSRWPDKVTKEAVWPQNGEPSKHLPEEIHQSIQQFLAMVCDKQPELCMELVCDLFKPAFL